MKLFLKLTALGAALFLLLLVPQAGQVFAFTETPALDYCASFPQVQPAEVYSQLSAKSEFDGFFERVAGGSTYLVFVVSRSDTTDSLYAITAPASQHLEATHMSGTSPNRTWRFDTFPNQTQTAIYTRINYSAVQSNFVDLWTDTPTSIQPDQSTTSDIWGGDSPSGTTKFCLIASSDPAPPINTDGSPAYIPTFTDIPPIYPDVCANIPNPQQSVPDGLEAIEGDCISPPSGGTGMEPSDLAQLIGITLAFGAGLWFLKYFVWGRSE